jgi:hypothetical protein
MKRTETFVLALLLSAPMMAACAGGSISGDLADAEGPPHVEMSTLREHAEQFDTDVPVRIAGSQEEQAAAGYITGTLQRNGYLVRLEAVPVGDLVNSSNLIGQPADVESPQVIVVVSYGTDEDGDEDGLALGLLLELARALNVEEANHEVFFVGVGADDAEVEAGYLGSRRLARMMLDEDWDPLVIQLTDIDEGGQLGASGDRADEFIEAMTATTGPFVEFDRGSVDVDVDVFAKAGFDSLLIAGDAEKLAEVLLDYLRRFTG